ncbi:MAG TPA: hypothetical protein VJT08_17745, partial [Terriglobales bacterium]|nr:hypothetical protein [Terriglobales bacterium]
VVYIPWSMNPDYMWIAETMELLSFFFVGPLLAISVAYLAWRGRPHSFGPKGYTIVCLASGVTALLLLQLAKWINADVRTPQYFVQLASILLSGLLIGIFVGSGFSVLFKIWRWHKTTRLIEEQ